MPDLLDTLREVGEAAVIPAVIALLVWGWNKWRTHTQGPKPEPRERPERVEPCDLAGEIHAYEIARDLREWEATRPGRWVA